jgi:hypothetical protein
MLMTLSIWLNLKVGAPSLLVRLSGRREAPQSKKYFKIREKNQRRIARFRCSFGVSKEK